MNDAVFQANKAIGIGEPAEFHPHRRRRRARLEIPEYPGINLGMASRTTGRPEDRGRETPRSGSCISLEFNISKSFPHHGFASRERARARWSRRLTL